jgi:transcriptional regulator with XRE-family HTH domain
MPEQAPTLRELIQDALDHGVTLRELADRAVDPETAETVSKDTINKIALGRINRMPYESHLRAIANALRISYEHVRRAAIAQWLPGTSPEIAAAPIDLREWASWTDDDRDLVLLAVRSANARARREGERRPGDAA